jgi:hypothetical protein
MRKPLNLEAFRAEIKPMTFVGLLYWTKMVIGGTTIYHLCNGDVAIEYEDRTKRMIHPDFSDETFENPSDESIEDIVIDALETGQFKKWYDDTIDACCIHFQVPRYLVGPRGNHDLLERYTKQILR